MEDKKIIALMQSDPPEGIRIAIDKYAGLVKTIISRVIPKHNEDIEECVSDVFVNIWKCSCNFEPATVNLKAYLICIARNTALNRYKYLKRRSFDNNLISMDDTMLKITSKTNIENDYLKDEDIDELLRAIEMLPEPEREIILRKHIMFESVTNISEKMGINQIKVKNKLQKGKKLLRDILIMRGVEFSETV